MKDRVVIERAWLEKFKDMCNENQLKEICYGLLQYGLYEEEIQSEDAIVNVVLNFVKPQIDSMQAAYERKVARGETVGRPAKIDAKTVYLMANDGMKAKEIAEALGQKEKSIYSNQGWVNRKNPNFLETLI